MKEEGGGVAADDRIRQLMMATSKDHAANNGSTLGTKVVPGVKPNSCEQLLIKIKQTQQYAKVMPLSFSRFRRKSVTDVVFVRTILLLFLSFFFRSSKLLINKLWKHLRVLTSNTRTVWAPSL